MSVDTIRNTPHRHLRSRNVELRPVLAADTEWLYVLMSQSEGGRWRYRGRTPSPGVFAADLWTGVHSQFVVCDGNVNPCGLVGLYNSNALAAHCHLFAISEPDQRTRVTEATGLMIDWAFDELEFDKIWIEAAEFNLQRFEGLRNIADVEGRLKNHDYWKGRFWDTFILSLSRQRWIDEMSASVQARSQALGASPRNGSQDDELGDLIGEIWPLDSLAAVELLTAIEETVDVAMDSSILEGLDRLDRAAASQELTHRVRLVLEQSAH